MAGGESQASDLLRTFVQEKRSVGYSKNVSSPNTAWTGCSRLSPYLTWGHISLRTVFQKSAETRKRLATDPSYKRACPAGWARDLSSFEARLRWRSHFMQKLEDEPEGETHNFCRAYDGLREDEFDRDKFNSWCSGNMGFPLADAVMRALLKGGWINFRMRAMLVSVASYMLWLDWRPTSRYLARHFLDYEPGIHYPQFQMQAGTTGINALRVYNPTKQVRDHDKEGKFIKRYVPELANVPTKYIAEPWKMPMKVQESSGCIIGKDYPEPIVDLKEMYKTSRARISAIRKQLKSKEEAKKVYEKHGSRMRPRGRGSKRKTPSSSEDGAGLKQKSLNAFIGKKPRPGA
mmetsp:Transcript_30770/g.60213  ORF Transcript_30770/g.60213 Transcript_30770/m.60213 type:complete len:347 (+) Transcript_30770:1-1041(+)